MNLRLVPIGAGMVILPDDRRVLGQWEDHSAGKTFWAVANAPAALIRSHGAEC